MLIFDMQANRMQIEKKTFRGTEECVWNTNELMKVNVIKRVVSAPIMTITIFHLEMIKLINNRLF